MVVVEKNLCASDLCQLLAVKNRVAKSVNWSIVEYWMDLGAAIENLITRFGLVLSWYQRIVGSAENIDGVNESVAESPKTSIRHRLQQFGHFKIVPATNCGKRPSSMHAGSIDPKTMAIKTEVCLPIGS
ncbi:hypothetical protein AMK59_499 [Oryctes borbonicus]|uniref:Uncharacterized protein n=1 Tax=Oryctes borbonicus TaxID=1629725 RepID=A0A0T6BH11_9SCAR|nr:hypothetical protein AMK59_499 [Oryctes borbonicus]